MPETIVSHVEDLTNDISATEGRAVILFTAPSRCRPCQQFKPHWERVVDEASEITFFYVDIDKVSDASVDYDVRSVPTVKLYENGTYVRDVEAPQGGVPFLLDIRS